MRWITRRAVTTSPPVPATSAGDDDLTARLNQLVRSWWRTADELHATTLKPGAGREHRLVTDAQARILNTAAHELNQLLKDADG